jgi:hypothetical protein
MQFQNIIISAIYTTKIEAEVEARVDQSEDNKAHLQITFNLQPL